MASASLKCTILSQNKKLAAHNVVPRIYSPNVAEGVSRMFTAIGRLGFHPLDPPRSPLRCPGSALAALIYMLVESAGVMTK